MIIQKLVKQKAIQPPKWLPTNVHYMTIMGSVAYGCSSDTSDNDVYGFCIPNKEMIFTHLAGEIPGFGKQIKRFEQWQEHHIIDTGSQKEYDFAIYSIVKYIQLCMENNPNMVDSLFTPVNCIIHSTEIGNMVRENRKLFLHKGCWPKFKGYAYSQLHKMAIKSPEEGSKRYADIMKHGYDVKFAYHVVRLLNEVQQILPTGDLDLQRDREMLKSIRRGEWKEEQIREYFALQEKSLETVYNESKLPWGPQTNQAAIKELLLNCLEHHFGSLDKAVVISSRHEDALRQIKDICDNVGV